MGCPKCFENCKIKIEDYNIQLYDCKNGHEINNILLREINNLQKIDESNIICNNCNKTNKAKEDKNQFFKCLTCGINICPSCKSIHNEKHNIIDYDKNNYVCNIHNEPYISFCNQCNMNLCMICEFVHQEHNITEFEEILPNENKIKEEMDKYKKK